jgi:hypothetical protein
MIFHVLIAMAAGCASPTPNADASPHWPIHSGAHASRQPLPRVAEPSCPLLTPRRAAWLVLRHEVNRTADEALRRFATGNQALGAVFQRWYPDPRLAEEPPAF